MPASTDTNPAVFDVYVLVHPERFASHCEAWIEPTRAESVFDYPEWDDCDHPVYEQGGAAFDARYGVHVAAAAAACTQRIVLLDDFGFEGLTEEEEWRPAAGEQAELTVGVPAEGWETRFLHAWFTKEFATEALADTAGKTVLLGGFARFDCVHRVQVALEGLGCSVILHEHGTLPLTIAAAHDFLDADPHPAPHLSTAELAQANSSDDDVLAL